MKSNANDDDQRKVRSYSMMIGHLQETTRSDTSVVEHEVQLTQQSGIIWAVYENGEWKVGISIIIISYP